MIGALYLSAANLLDDVRAALEDGPTTAPSRRFVTAGAITWAGQCDQLVVSIGPTWPTSNFPTPTLEPGAACDAAMLGCDLILSIIRCFPTVDAAGNPPSIDAVQQVAQQIGADHQTLGNIVPCALAEQIGAPTNLIEDYTIGLANTVGPDGGRIAIELAYRIGLLRG
jgi:hypothetical protein